MSTQLVCMVCGEPGGQAAQQPDRDLCFDRPAWLDSHVLVHARCKQMFEWSFAPEELESPPVSVNAVHTHFAVVRDGAGNEVVRYSCLCDGEADHDADQTVVP